jgi:site-specific recombinase XerD
MPQNYYPSGPFLSQRPDAGDFDTLREDFLLGFGEATARAYKADLEDFKEWCVTAEVDPLSSSLSDPDRYVLSLQARGYAIGTIRRRLAALRGFREHLDAQDAVVRPLAAKPDIEAEGPS